MYNLQVYDIENFHTISLSYVLGFVMKLIKCLCSDILFHKLFIKL